MHHACASSLQGCRWNWLGSTSFFKEEAFHISLSTIQFARSILYPQNGLKFIPNPNFTKSMV
jgi:hypothetical protein